MEVFGAVASALTILELAREIKVLSVNVKHAKEDWQRYCDRLQSIACIQNVLNAIAEGPPDIPAIRELVVEVDREEGSVSIPLVEHVNTVLSKVANDAETLLDRHAQLPSSSSFRFKTYLKKICPLFRLALNKDTIVSLVESVEHARQHLHMALTLVNLRSFTSWYKIFPMIFCKTRVARLTQAHQRQSESRSLLDKILTNMGRHANDPLAKLDESGQQVQGALKLDILESLSHDRDLPKHRDGAQNTSAPKGATLDHRSLRSIARYSLSRGSFSKKKRSSRTLSLDKGSTPLASALEGSAEQGVKNDNDSGHDADDSSEDEDAQPNQGIGNTFARETSHNIAHVSAYEIVSDNGKWVQVPVDSAMCQPANSPQHLDEDHPSPVGASTAIRLEPIIESLSEAEWDNAQHLSREELTDFLISAQPTACATDVETWAGNNPSSPIIIESDCESRIFIAETVDMASCRARAGSTSLNFCTERVSVTDNTQSFCVIDPCAETGMLGCRHITMRVMNGDVCKAKELPLAMQLASWCVGEPPDDVLNDGVSRRNDKVASLSGSRLRRLPLGERRNYTVFDQGGRKERALPVKIFTSLQMDSDGSGASTVNPPSEDDGHEAENDQLEEQALGTAGFPTNPEPGDDEDAFSLLRLINLYDTYEPPAGIDWDTLIQFVFPMDKYGQYVGGRPMSQARSWASLIQRPKSCNTNALPWLWITWKLGMGPEFLDISAIIQREAQFPVSHWQDGPENKYGIKLPELILNRLDERRLEALSRVKMRMTSEIEMSRQRFLQAAEGGPLPCSAGSVMLSSLVFGYLKLESDRFLKSRDQGEDVDLPTFWGVSFAEVKECISSMQELNDWNVCTADRMPAPLATLFAIIPIVGVGLHNEDIHVRTGRCYKDELSRLIQEIEMETWGINLDQIG